MILGEHNMRKNNFMKKLSLILCVVFIAAMTLFTACSDNKAKDEPTTTVTDNNEKESPHDDSNVLGEGEVSFTFTVVDGAGNETKFTINTDKRKVGDALLEHKLIEGEDGDYGLYVKKVNGITADYDVTKTYWAFYIDGKYAMTGVDKTDVKAGVVYTFKVEK